VKRSTRGWIRVVAAAVALVSAVSCGSGHAASVTPRGTYRAAMGPNVLTLGAGTWTLRSGIRVKSGQFRLNGDRISFVHESANNVAYRGDYCRGVRETYTFTVDDDTLSFRNVSRPCDWNLYAVLTVAGPWHRR
jgi:hypothetical protein